MDTITTAEDAIAGDGRPSRRGTNQNGQAMGPKGLKTRRRLIDATTALLATQRLRDLRVADIAREARTSSATFYLYFNEVTDAVLAAIHEIRQSTPELLDLVGGDWSRQPRERARAIIESYVRFWKTHAPLFRIRNLAAEEGDERFRLAREESTRQLLLGIARQVDRAQAAGWVDRALHPASTAGVLMAMLERLAAVIGTSSGEDITPDRMIEAAACVFVSMLGPSAAVQAPTG